MNEIDVKQFFKIRKYFPYKRIRSYNKLNLFVEIKILQRWMGEI